MSDWSDSHASEIEIEASARLPPFVWDGDQLAATGDATPNQLLPEFGDFSVGGIFDGEIVAFDDGVPHFPLVCDRLPGGRRHGRQVSGSGRGRSRCRRRLLYSTCRCRRTDTAAGASSSRPAARSRTGCSGRCRS